MPVGFTVNAVAVMMTGKVCGKRRTLTRTIRDEPSEELLWLSRLGKHKSELSVIQSINVRATSLSIAYCKLTRWMSICIYVCPYL